MRTNNKQLYETIGKRIKTIRKAAGVNQDDLAAHVGLSRTSISNIEGGGQKTQLDTLYAISYFLDVSIFSLLPGGEWETGEISEAAKKSSMNIWAKVRDVMADRVHKVWGRWMKYQFRCGVMMPDGSFVLPPAMVERWQRQIDTEFKDLQPAEQHSDLLIAVEYMDIIESWDDEK